MTPEARQEAQRRFLLAEKLELLCNRIRERLLSGDDFSIEDANIIQMKSLMLDVGCFSSDIKVGDASDMTNPEIKEQNQ